MEHKKSFLRSLGAAVTAVFRLLKLLAFAVLLVASALYIWGMFNDDGISLQPKRDYPEAPAPVQFTPIDQLNLNESTAAPGLTSDERYDRLLRSTVLVMSGDAMGSGVIIDNQKCLVITNEHVVSLDGTLTARVVTRFRANGEHVTREVGAEIVGRPSAADGLAVLKLAECANLPWAPLGNSNLLRAGDQVIAVGHPEGFAWSVTDGIVSHPARFWDDYSNNSGFPLIQTDAAINPGNSGGGLFMPNGLLVGINSMRDPFAQNLGFARSSMLVHGYMGRLATDGRVTERALGVIISERDAGLPGLEIQEVVDGGIAAQAGLQPGDLVLAVNGIPLDGNASLKRGMYADADGSVEFTIHRGTERYTLTVDY